MSASGATPALRATLASILTWDAFRPAVDPLTLAKMSPAVAARRARLQKWVKGVVAACGAVCLIALVRVATAASPESAVTITSSAVMRKAVESKTLAVEEEVRAVHAASAMAVMHKADKGGTRHR